VDNSNNQSKILRNNDNGKDENIIKVGRGVALVHNGRRIAVGNMKFIEDEVKSTSSKHGDTSTQGLLLNKRQYQYLTNTQTFQKFDPIDMLFSSTTAFVSLDGQIIGVVLLEDTLRQETKEAIAKIKAMNIHVVMLTGDNERTARKIANEAGLRNVMLICSQKRRFQ